VVDGTPDAARSDRWCPDRRAADRRAAGGDPACRCPPY